MILFYMRRMKKAKANLIKSMKIPPVLVQENEALSPIQAE
jgi:hypothetical protein